MADATYQPKVYRTSGGDGLVVASGGALDVESGGTCTVESGGALTADSGSTVTISGSLVRTRQLMINTEAKIGATSSVGWVLGGGAVNTGSMATLAASATADTLVVPIGGLHIGDTITGFSLNGQIESAGGAVTLDANLRALTAVAAGNTDASIGAITQVAASSDTLVSVANAVKTGLSEVVAVGKSYYVLITGTTAGSTDIDLLNIIVNVTTA